VSASSAAACGSAPVTTEVRDIALTVFGQDASSTLVDSSGNKLGKLELPAASFIFKNDQADPIVQMEVTAASRDQFQGAAGPSGASDSIKSLLSPVIHLQVSSTVQQPFPTPIYVTFTAENPLNKSLCCSFINETVTPPRWECVSNATRLGLTNEYRCPLPHNSVWALYLNTSAPYPVETFPSGDVDEASGSSALLILLISFVCVFVLVLVVGLAFLRRKKVATVFPLFVIDDGRSSGDASLYPLFASVVIAAREEKLDPPIEEE